MALFQIILTAWAYLGLLVVLHGHSDNVEAYYDGDEEIQVVASAHLVDEATSGRVVRVVRLTLSLCDEEPAGPGSKHEIRLLTETLVKKTHIPMRKRKEEKNKKRSLKNKERNRQKGPSAILRIRVQDRRAVQVDITSPSQEHTLFQIPNILIGFPEMHVLLLFERWTNSDLESLNGTSTLWL